MALDTQQKRKDYEVSIVRTVLLASSETNEQMTEISRLVRENRWITRTDLDTKSRPSTMRASPQAIAVATGVIEDLQRPPDELILEIEVMEVDRNHNGTWASPDRKPRQSIRSPQTPRSWCNRAALQLFNALLTQVFGSTAAIPPVLAFGGGNTTFFVHAARSHRDAFELSFQRTLGPAGATPRGRWPACNVFCWRTLSGFVGAQYSSSLVGSASATATQVPTAWRPIPMPAVQSPRSRPVQIRTSWLRRIC